MDDTVAAVLATYHERIEHERALRRENPIKSPLPNGQDPWMRAVGPATGQLLNILARSLERPHILEIGTSYGYSGIWLAEAARAREGRVTTMEMYDYKSAHAKDMATRAGLADWVDFQVGDALALIAALPHGIDFVLLDLWKDLYEPCLEAFYPKLNPGAIIVADNMIRPGDEGIVRYSRAIRSKPGVRSLLLPVGSGIEVSRYEP
ncbi:O-methyltransferase [Pararobbsia silviterrae]|uniref:DUF1442 domain-containing protein n=1 Tax=Pararobbsia silviterrae TaxID=1792498 RepID=A0A494XZC9_9BURK|nr:class I SAM-dependent methyltransferase [Pararobbsia silviterrae]RKP53459.1 DUF1442 domain-containing protein [Pararobbsia silviterrae]